mmetsp:Transcript_3375/g.7970  ORF Transcript_3375/g.7970 Transcript_3375/m.7970 type:complete len:80 (-) Transcript_3375:12-251(-)
MCCFACSSLDAAAMPGFWNCPLHRPHSVGLWVSPSATTSRASCLYSSAEKSALGVLLCSPVCVYAVTSPVYFGSDDVSG